MDYNALLREAATEMSALEALYRALRGDALGIAYGILRSYPFAEDAVQEGFIRLPDAAKRYRGGDARAFVLSVVRYTALESLRKHRRELAVETLPEQGDAPVDRDGALDVRAALGRLNRKEREVMMLRYYSGMAFREIAEALHAPEGTVKWRCARALEKLRAVLKD